MRHKNIHTLVLCNVNNWNELQYVKNRRKEETINTYKSQDYRYEDVQ